MQINKILLTACLLFVVCTMKLSPVHAAAMGFNEDKAMIRLGGFFVRNFDTIIRVDSKQGPVGSFIKLDDNLGVEDDLNVLRLDGYYRFGFKHRVDFSWYRTNRSGTKILEKEFTFNGETFLIGDEINTEIDTNLFKASYTYSLYRVPELELGVSVGLHYVSHDMEINSKSSFVSEDESFDLPMPVAGFFFDYALMRKLSLQVLSETFLVNYNEVRGSMTDFNIGLEYRTSDNYAFGLAINRSVLAVEQDKRKEEISVRTEKTGYLLYAAYYFSAHKD
jgi:hypothetical protein